VWDNAQCDIPKQTWTERDRQTNTDRSDKEDKEGREGQVETHRDRGCDSRTDRIQSIETDIDDMNRDVERSTKRDTHEK